MLQHLGSDQELLANLTGINSLLDASIEQITIGMLDPGQGVSAGLVFKLIRRASYGRIRIDFTLVQEYGFSWSRHHTFYNVERLKFFRTPAGLYYLSLDPVDEAEVVDSNDQDFVLAEYVSGYLLP